MAGLLPPNPVPGPSTGTRRTWAAMMEDDTKEILQLAEQFAHAHPVKRQRVALPEYKSIMRMLDQPLSLVRLRRLRREVDEDGNILNETKCLYLEMSAVRRKEQVYSGMPKPTVEEGALVQHEEWNHKDDIVEVRVARQASGGYPKHYVVFKLSKDVLVNNLEPMHDMFKDHKEQEKEAKETGAPILVPGLTFSDEQPVITIEHETPEDWALMCWVLFKPRHYGAQPHHWDDIGRLLELARKYNCFTLRQAAVANLSALFPTTHQNFKKRIHLEEHVYGKPLYWVVEALVRFALPYRLYELLPTIRYEVASQYSIEEMLLGWPECDGRPAMRLPDEELERLLRGQESLSHMRRLHTLAPLVNISRVEPININCTHTNGGFSCHHALALFADRLLAKTKVWGPKYALSSLDGLSSQYLHDYVCKKCFSKLKIDLGRKEREAWRMLPTVFGMGTWFDVELRAEWVRQRDYGWWHLQAAERIAAETVNAHRPTEAEKDIQIINEVAQALWRGDGGGNLAEVEQMNIFEGEAIVQASLAEVHHFMTLEHMEGVPVPLDYGPSESDDPLTNGFVTSIGGGGNLQQWAEEEEEGLVNEEWLEDEELGFGEDEEDSLEVDEGVEFEHFHQALLQAGDAVGAQEAQGAEAQAAEVAEEVEETEEGADADEVEVAEEVEETEEDVEVAEDDEQPPE